MTVTLNAGERANLFCDPKRDARAKPFILTTWYKGKRAHRRPLPQHIKAHHDILIVNGLLVSDVGDYTCTGTRSDGSQETIVVQLQVGDQQPGKENEEKPTVRISGGENEIEAERSFELRCITTGSSRVVWLFNNNPIVGNGDFVPQNNGVLLVRRITESLAGQYTCRAFNNHGDFADSTRYIRMAPKVPLPGVKIEEVSSVGARREYLCRVDSAERVTWLFNNIDVASFPNLEQKNRNLVINNVGLDSFGLYTCRAFNSAGQYVDATLELKSHQPILVEVNPRFANAFVGENFEFTCMVTNQDVAGLRISWTKDGAALPSNAIESDSGLLTIRNLQEYNSGEYSCTVIHSKTRVTNSTSARLEVTPRVQVEPLKVVVNPSKAKFVVGLPAELDCEVEGGSNPKLSWSKVGGDLDGRFVTRGSVLMIEKVANDDRGYFQCKVDDDSESAIAYVLVEVEERIRPAVEIYPAGDQKLRKGDSTYAQCRVIAGEPSPTVEWRRVDGRPFSSRVTVINSGTVLSVKDSESEDFGSYECVAKNVAGESSMSVSLIEERQQNEELEESVVVIPEPEPEPEREDQNPVEPSNEEFPEVTIEKSFYEVNEGDNQQLVCKSNIVNGEFEWTKGSSRLYNGYNGEYNLRNIRVEDAGDYMCLIRNANGYASKTIRVIVKKTSFKVHVTPKEQVVNLDGTTEFSCKVDSSDAGEVLYQWSKPGGVLPANHQTFSNVLRINNAQEDAAGRYQCTVLLGASSVYDIGHLEVSQNDPKSAFPVYIRVLEKPQITSQNPEGAFRLGTKLTLECYVKGLRLNSSPKWRKVDGIIRQNFNTESQDTSATISGSILPMDFGKFVCSAEGYAVDGSLAVGQSEISILREQHNEFKYIIHGPKELPGGGSSSQNNENVETTQDQSESAPKAIFSNPQQTLVNQGESITLVCDATGYPMPEITFEKNGGSLPQSHSISGNNLRLVIIYVSL
jgi:hypothetical protein